MEPIREHQQRYLRLPRSSSIRRSAIYPITPCSFSTRRSRFLHDYV
jgi:hypothetical protein